MSRLSSKPVVLATRGDLVVLSDPRRPTGRLLRQDDMDASYIDLADPTHLEFEYMRWMRIVLLAARARRNLHIGGGACALPRALAARDPQGLQVVCESDPEVLEMAREHFRLRRIPGLRVRNAEGRKSLRHQANRSFDAVVVDAFVGAAVPLALTSPEAFAEMARVAPLVLINVVDSRIGHEIQAVARNLAPSYPQLWRIGGRGAGNTVLVGGRLPRPAIDRIAAELARDPAPAQLSRPRL